MRVHDEDCDLEDGHDHIDIKIEEVLPILKYYKFKIKSKEVKIKESLNDHLRDSYTHKVID